MECKQARPNTVAISQVPSGWLKLAEDCAREYERLSMTRVGVRGCERLSMWTCERAIERLQHQGHVGADSAQTSLPLPTV